MSKLKLQINALIHINQIIDDISDIIYCEMYGGPFDGGVSEEYLHQVYRDISNLIGDSDIINDSFKKQVYHFIDHHMIINPRIQNGGAPKELNKLVTFIGDHIGDLRDKLLDIK